MTTDPDATAEYDPAEGLDPFHSNLSTGRSLVERLLLSVIDAYSDPDAGKEREKRLQTAMKALFGPRLLTGRPPMANHKAFLWIANQILKSRQEPFVRHWRQSKGLPGEAGKSETDEQLLNRLCQEAAGQFHPRANRKLSDKERKNLAKVFRTQWDQKSQRWPNGQGEFRLTLAKYHDDVPESIQTQQLARIWIAMIDAKLSVAPNDPTGDRLTETAMKRSGLEVLESLAGRLEGRNS